MLLAFPCAARAESAKIEVQGVSASEPGKKPVSIPESLAKYKELLEKTTYGTFRDAGHDKVKAAAGAKDSATIGTYTVEVEVTKIVRGEKVKVTVTISEGKKPVGQPLSYMLAKDRTPVTIEVGGKEKDTATIFILTLHSIE
jgi:hypothetical protein